MGVRVCVCVCVLLFLVVVFLSFFSLLASSYSKKKAKKTDTHNG